MAGAGYRLIDAERLKLAVDGALGGAWEKLRDRPATTSLALQASQVLSFKLSPSAALTQSASALWKTENFGDAIYRLAALVLEF